MKRFIFAIILVFSQVGFAEGIYELGKESNDAVYHLSLCASEISKVVSPGTWIGKTERWDSRTKNYGYNFFVFERAGFTTAKPVGKISLLAEYIQNPPADGSSYKYSCTVEFKIAR